MYYNRHKFVFVGNVKHAFKLDFGGWDRFRTSVSRLISLGCIRRDECASFSDGKARGPGGELPQFGRRVVRQTGGQVVARGI